MSTRKHCPKCQASMAEGFIPVDRDGSRKVSRWVEGRPEKRWFGIRTRGRKQIDVQTFRCTRCGYLENYAPE